MMMSPSDFKDTVEAICKAYDRGFIDHKSAKESVQVAMSMTFGFRPVNPDAPRPGEYKESCHTDNK